MSNEWYCRIMGDQWGPMSAQELLAVARRGRLTRDDLVRQGAHGTWVRAEVVKGLFNNAELAPTATSSRVAISPRQPSPAKRSLQALRPRQYWIKMGGRKAGPFSGAKIRALAAEGILKPHYLISDDRKNWIGASQVKGLSFGGASPDAATASIRSAVWPLQTMPPSADAATIDADAPGTRGLALSHSGR